MRITSLLTLVLSLPLIVPAAAQPARPHVMLRAGGLDGTLPEGAPGAVFRGIPFAQPPIGPLRWRAPLPVMPWRGSRDASSPGPVCAQNSAKGPTGDEDCLHLNIWTPEWPARPGRPVMLWLFGGANVVGSANNPVFDGAALARRGVVVVTANFRVGAMGFMAHPALSAESAHRSSGNYALLDQIMALRWIRSNIAKFGGDPRNVTVFGQSSGSYDLFLLMTSPLARGLFHKAIAQSGQFLSYDGPMAKARAEGIGASIAADLKAPPGPHALSYLRALPADQVVTAAAKWLPTQPGTDTGLLTAIDGWVLRESSARVFASGRQMPIPLILGNNAREIGWPVALDDLRKMIGGRYGELAPKALDAYGLGNGGQGRDDPLLGTPSAQWWTDIVQRCGAVMEAQWHAAAGRPTWQYQFERSIPGKEAAGSTHGAEVAFVFGNLDRVPEKPAFTASDRAASAQIQEYWTRFARTGNPNGGELPAWPRAGGGRYLAFTAEGAIAKANLQPGPCGVYREWTLRRLSSSSKRIAN